MKPENLLPGDIIVNRRFNAYEGGPLRWKIVARRSGNDGWELVHPDNPNSKSAIADDIFEKNGWEFESREEPETPLYWGEVVVASDMQVTIRLAKGNHSTGVVGTHVAVFTDQNWDSERAAKIEGVAKAIADSYLQYAPSENKRYEDLAEPVKNDYRKMAEAALDHLENEDA